MQWRLHCTEDIYTQKTQKPKLRYLGFLPILIMCKPFKRGIYIFTELMLFINDGIYLGLVDKWLTSSLVGMFGQY